MSFLNKIIEKKKIKYIWKYQIQKGVGGLKKLISKKNNFSTALMMIKEFPGNFSNFLIIML